MEIVSVAKQVRNDLKAAFPSVKFSVRSRDFAGGDSINVDYYQGPVQSEVKKLLAKHAGETRFV